MLLLMLAVLPAERGYAKALPTTLGMQALETFQKVQEPLLEQTVFVEGPGKMLHIAYASDRPLSVTILFPETPTNNDLQWNPLHAIRAQLPSSKDGEEYMDLTTSPDWAPDRTFYAVTFQAPEEAKIEMHDLTVQGKISVLDRTRAIIRHWFTPEPRLLSSIVFVNGYTIMGQSLTLILGILLIITASIVLLLTKDLRPVLSVCLGFLLLYDARWSVDLLHATAQDLQEWNAGSYRQLGPLVEVADFLKEEDQHVDSESATLCTNDANFYHRWLRYVLYPTMELQLAEDNWQSAHIAVLHTGSFDLATGIASCPNQTPRPAQLLRSFSEGVSVVRFTDTPL